MTMIQAALRKLKPIKPPFIRDYRVFLVNFRQNLLQSFPFFYEIKGKMRPFSVKLGIFRQGGLFQTSVGLKKVLEKVIESPLFLLNLRLLFQN